VSSETSYVQLCVESTALAVNGIPATDQSVVFEEDFVRNPAYPNDNVRKTCVLITYVHGVWKKGPTTFRE